MIFDSTDKNKELLKKYNDVFNGIRSKIKEVSSDECDYKKDYTNTKFNSDDNLPLNKPLKFTISLYLSDLFLKKMVNFICKFSRWYFIWTKNIKMLEYDKIDISDGIDVNKTGASKECDICHYWCLRDVGFKYEKYLCNGCHDLMEKAMSCINVAIVYVKESAYKIHFWYMSKDDATNVINGSYLTDKSGVL